MARVGNIAGNKRQITKVKHEKVEKVKKPPASGRPSRTKDATIPAPVASRRGKPQKKLSRPAKNQLHQKPAASEVTSDEDTEGEEGEEVEEVELVEEEDDGDAADDLPKTKVRKRARGGSVKKSNLKLGHLSVDVADEFFNEFLGLPSGGLDLKSACSQYNRVQTEPKRLAVETLFSEKQGGRFVWRPQLMRNSSPMEKAEIEDICYRLYGKGIGCGIVPTRLAWAWYLWRIDKEEVDWFLYAKDVLAGQFRLQSIGQGSIRSDWVAFVEAKQGGGHRELPTRLPMLCHDSDSKLNERSASTNVTAAGVASTNGSPVGLGTQSSGSGWACSANQPAAAISAAPTSQSPVTPAANAMGAANEMIAAQAAVSTAIILLGQAQQELGREVSTPINEGQVTKPGGADGHLDLLPKSQETHDPPAAADEDSEQVLNEDDHQPITLEDDPIDVREAYHSTPWRQLNVSPDPGGHLPPFTASFIMESEQLDAGAVTAEDVDNGQSVLSNVNSMGTTLLTDSTILLHMDVVDIGVDAASTLVTGVQSSADQVGPVVLEHTSAPSDTATCVTTDHIQLPIIVTTAEDIQTSTPPQAGLHEEVGDSTMQDVPEEAPCVAAVVPATKGKIRGRKSKAEKAAAEAATMKLDGVQGGRADVEENLAAADPLEASPRKSSLRSGGNPEGHCELQSMKRAIKPTVIFSPAGQKTTVKVKAKSTSMSAVVVTDDSPEPSRPPKSFSTQQVMQKTVKSKPPKSSHKILTSAPTE